MSAIYSTMVYSGQTVKIAKVSKKNIRGSVDGNKYGTSYDKTIPQGFSDKSLIESGYTEAVACNGSIFYPYNNDTYAEGIEISKGVNNQDFGMSCVTSLNETMAVGFPYDGGLVFAKQKDIIAEYGRYYGALTFCFGIMKDGVKAEWGKDQASEYRGISGRTILGQNDEYVFAVSIAGVTGKSGLKGSQLFDLCKKIGMKDAGCFDGGGSVFMRVNGEYKNLTTRKVKNAWMIFTKSTGDTTVKSEDKVSDDDTVKGSFKFRAIVGAYGTKKDKIATRPSASAKYDTAYPLYVGDEFEVDQMVSEGGYWIAHMTTGRQAGRWTQLDPNNFKQI